MYCINCGKELPENARFCLYCGAKVNVIEEKKQVSNDEVLTNYLVNTIPFIYDNLSECTDYPYIYGYINGKVGLLDAKDASMVVPCQYDKIATYFYTESKQFSYSEVNKDGKWGFFEKGKEIVPCIYDSINPQKYNNTRIYIVAIGSKKGLINSNTWDKTECIYDKVEFIHNFFLISYNGKQGLLRLDFKEVLPCIYDNVTQLGNRFMCLEQNHKYGVYAMSSQYNSDSKIITPCIYDSVTISNDRFFIVAQNNKYGVYNYWWGEIEPCIHDNIQYVKDIETKTDDRFIEIKSDSKTIIKELNTKKTIVVNKFEPLLLDYTKLQKS